MDQHIAAWTLKRLRAVKSVETIELLPFQENGENGLSVTASSAAAVGTGNETAAEIPGRNRGQNRGRQSRAGSAARLGGRPDFPRPFPFAGARSSALGSSPHGSARPPSGLSGPRGKSVPRRVP